MSLLLKDPAAILDYAVDWAAEYLESDQILQSDWTVEPGEEGGAEIVANDVAGGAAIVKVGSGIAGHIYRLTNHVLLESGREDSRSIVLRVEQR
jgi:hypothetical protein